MNDSETLNNIDKKLSALISLMIVSITETNDNKMKIKPELILSNLGLESSEIANILGKKLTAVQKALQRAKK